MAQLKAEQGHSQAAVANAGNAAVAVLAADTEPAAAGVAPRLAGVPVRVADALRSSPGIATPSPVDNLRLLPQCCFSRALQTLVPGHTQQPCCALTTLLAPLPPAKTPVDIDWAAGEAAKPQGPAQMSREADVAALAIGFDTTRIVTTATEPKQAGGKAPQSVAVLTLEARGHGHIAPGPRLHSGHRLVRAVVPIAVVEVGAEKILESRGSAAQWAVAGESIARYSPCDMRSFVAGGIVPAIGVG